MERKKMVEEAGMTWSVVESLPVHEDIKTASGSFKRFMELYKQSIRHLGQCGIKTITYNFMPVLDWIRTDLHHELPDGSKVLYFNQIEFAVFELLILRRKSAEKDYSAETIAKAEDMYRNMSDHQRFVLTRSIIDNFPGFKGVTLEDIRRCLPNMKISLRRSCGKTLPCSSMKLSRLRRNGDAEWLFTLMIHHGESLAFQEL